MGAGQVGSKEFLLNEYYFYNERYVTKSVLFDEERTNNIYVPNFGLQINVLNSAHDKVIRTINLAT